jgi:hypothetical protein
VTRLRYEDLVAEPSNGFRRVAEFAGLSDDAAWRASLARLPISDKNDGWRSRLEPSVVELITSIQRPGLDRYGYEN